MATNAIPVLCQRPSAIRLAPLILAAMYGRVVGRMTKTVAGRPPNQRRTNGNERSLTIQHLANRQTDNLGRKKGCMALAPRLLRFLTLNSSVVVHGSDGVSMRSAPYPTCLISLGCYLSLAILVFGSWTHSMRLWGTEHLHRCQYGWPRERA